MGMHAETLAWLEGQLDELDRWRADLINEANQDETHVLERIEDHRQWLETELTRFNRNALLNTQ